MHVILGLLGTIVTILWLLHRLAEMGIDLGGLNPFLWHRRRTWRKSHDADPIFKISSPLDATALLVTATAKADGDMSSEEKEAVLSLFENEFHLSKKESASLLTSSSHLLGKGDEIHNNLNKVLEPSLESFSIEQADSAIALLKKTAMVGGSASELQNELIARASSILIQNTGQKSKWE